MDASLRQNGAHIALRLAQKRSGNASGQTRKLIRETTQQASGTMRQDRAPSLKHSPKVMRWEK